MKTNCNRDQFKRIFSFFAAVLLVGMYAAGFAWVWYESYSSAILLPFYRRGNWVMILIYVVLVLLFGKTVMRRRRYGSGRGRRGRPRSYRGRRF